MAKRMKAPELPVPQTTAAAEDMLAYIGRLQRQVEKIETDMNEQLAAVKKDFEARAAPLTAEIDQHFDALRAWAEAQKALLLVDARKSVKLASGELGWRTTPPAVAIRGAEAVLGALDELKLERFIRTKREIDKTAILKEPEAVRHVKGISITRREEFWIRPFESQIERVRRI